MATTKKTTPGTPDENTVKNIVQKKHGKQFDPPVPIEPGDNAHYLQHSMQVAGLPQINTHNAAEVQQRITEYFTLCVQNDMKPSVAGLALALHCHRNTLYEWANDRAPQMPPECRELFKHAYRLINAQMEDYMQNGKINPVAGIFLMKNNLGYKDMQEYVLTPNAQPERSAEDLINEANQLPDSTDE